MSNCEAVLLLWWIVQMLIMTHTFGQSVLESYHCVALVCTHIKVTNRGLRPVHTKQLETRKASIYCEWNLRHGGPTLSLKSREVKFYANCLSCWSINLETTNHAGSDFCFDCLYVGRGCQFEPCLRLPFRKPGNCCIRQESVLKSEKKTKKLSSSSSFVTTEVSGADQNALHLKYAEALRLKMLSHFCLDKLVI